MLKTDIFFSIIIPSFNREKTIYDCLQSIFQQTFQQFEIIVVDDCSKDNTCKIIEQLVENNCRLRLIKLEKNSGAQVARNIGIKNARYEWVAFLDSDDFWTKDKLESQLEVIQKHNFREDLVIYSNCYVEKDGSRSLWTLPKMEGRCFQKLLTSSGPMFQSLVTTKSALQHIGFLDETIVSYQEWDTAISLSKDNFFVYMSKPTFIYNIHEGETISKNKLRNIDGYIQVINKFRDEICQENLLIWDRHILLLIDKAIDYDIDYDIEKLVNSLENRIMSFQLKKMFNIGSNFVFEKSVKILIKLHNVLLRLDK